MLQSLHALAAAQRQQAVRPNPLCTRTDRRITIADWAAAVHSAQHSAKHSAHTMNSQLLRMATGLGELANTSLRPWMGPVHAGGRRCND